MGKIISITNQKGGVGKTTSAINISACLAKSGEKILLVDMDPQANTTSGIGMNKSTIKLSSYDGLILGVDCNKLIHQTDYSNLFLVPSNVNLTGAEIELTQIDAREYKLKKMVSPVRNDFDYIIIDCPPSLGLLTLNSLTASDSVLIPIQAEYFALEGVGQLVQTLDLVRKNLNPNLAIEGILLTMCDFRTNLSKQVAEEVRRYFGDKVYKTSIPRNIKIAESPGFGKPIVYYEMRSIGAEKYLEVTAEFLKLNRN
ncbi:MAG: ParA family protein [Candidatus Aureabacteria bacterium]|nr:ParA family protein [Candidatus Auribacterota bacterium]